MPPDSSLRARISSMFSVQKGAAKLFRCKSIPSLRYSFVLMRLLAISVLYVHVRIALFSTKSFCTHVCVMMWCMCHWMCIHVSTLDTIEIRPAEIASKWANTRRRKSTEPICQIKIQIKWEKRFQLCVLLYIPIFLCLFVCLCAYAVARQCVRALFFLPFVLYSFLCACRNIVMMEIMKRKMAMQ